MTLEYKQLNLHNLLKQKSFFLFGPRATGKTTLIKQQFTESIPIINLLRSEIYMRLNTNPHELEQIIKNFPNYSTVIIDEIQRVPMLLNEVHRLIEEEKIKFLLTGSSARKLKQAEVNLLAGRAWTAELFPLIYNEIPKFNLKKYLRYGGLPPVQLGEAPEEELHAYVNTYLREEIQAESLVRKIPAFSRFLQASALTSGKMLKYTEIASDSSIPVTTIREYYSILEDTFIGFIVPAWTKSTKRKAISTSKFYYFDLGVKNTLAGIQNIPPQSDLFGQAFEHFIALELRAYISYKRLRLSLSYWQSKHGHEVDFIIGDDIAIEVKATNKTQDKHLKGLKYLAEENICKRYFLVSQDTVGRKQEKFEIIHWQDFLEMLWQGRII